MATQAAPAKSVKMTRERFLKVIHEENQAIGGHNFKRTFYNYLKAKWKPRHTGVILQPGYLFSSCLLGNGTSYTFSINENDGNTNANGQVVLSTTQRINQNDVFEACEWAVVIYTQDTTNNPPFSTRILYTYENPFIFSGAAVAGVTEAQAMGAIYWGGSLKIEISTTTILRNLDCLRFRRVPTSQQGVVQAAIAGPVTYTIPRDGFDNVDYMFDETVPFLTFNGNGNNVISLTLADGLNLTPTNYSRSNAANYVALYVRGFLAANGAKQSNRALV